MRIFAGVSWRWGVKRQWGCRKRRFSVAPLLVSSEALQVRPKLLYTVSRGNIVLPGNCSLLQTALFTYILKLFAVQDPAYLFLISIDVLLQTRSDNLVLSFSGPDSVGWQICSRQKTYDATKSDLNFPRCIVCCLAHANDSMMSKKNKKRVYTQIWHAIAIIHVKQKRSTYHFLSYPWFWLFILSQISQRWNAIIWRFQAII